MNSPESLRKLSANGKRRLSGNLMQTTLIFTFLLISTIQASGETLYRYPGQDLKSEWSSQGCISHYNCLNEEVKNPAVPGTGDFITADSSSTLTDQHSVNGTLPADINWLALNIYANTTGNAKINTEIINNSVTASDDLIDTNSTAWSSINWTTPAETFNLSGRFRPQAGAGQTANASIYSWYFEIDYNNEPPRWRNQSQNKISVTSSEPLKLSAQGRDRLNLTNATLATNETGKFQNISGKYGSPLQIQKGGEWVWSNFTWQSQEVKNALVGWKIYYSDSDGATNSTDVQTFEVNSPMVENISFDRNPVEAGLVLNITADVLSPSSYSLDTVKINLSDAANNTETYQEMKTYADGYYHSEMVVNESSNIGDWNVTVEANNTYGARSENSSTLEVLEKKPPKWRNISQQKKDIDTGSSNVLKAEGFDNFLLENATLSTNETGVWENKTSNYSSPKNLGTSGLWSETSFIWSNSSLNNTLVSWRIWYSDSQGQYTSTDTRSFSINGKDMNVTDLYLNTSNPVQGNTVKLTANITNTGSGKVSSEDLNLTVEEYNGSWILIDTERKLRDISEGSSITANFTWTVGPGPYRFKVEADQDDTLNELNETNNQERLYKNISSYTVVYGGNSAEIILGGSDSRFVSWKADHRNMSLFLKDKDLKLSTPDLSPLNSTGDLGEADQALNLTGHHDSISKLYDENSDQQPDNTRCWTVASEELCDIPVINSTESSDFKTGLLYNAENGNEYDGSQEVVLVTPVNNSATGSFGVYDYEVKIPFALDRQIPSQNSVTITGEIY